MTRNCQISCIYFATEEYKPEYETAEVYLNNKLSTQYDTLVLSYYKNHRTVEWARIFALPRPLPSVNSNHHFSLLAAASIITLQINGW